MTDVQLHDLRAVLDAAAILACVDTMTALEQAAFPALADLLHADWLVYHEMDLSLPRELSLPWPRDLFPPAWMDGYAAVIPGHPLLQRIADVDATGGLRVSDVVSTVAWRSSSTYVDLLGGLGADDQMVCVLARTGPRVQAFSVSRTGRAFTLQDRARLRLLQRHLAAAVARARRASPACLAVQVVPEPGWALLGPDGGPRQALLTRREEEVLALLADGSTAGQVARALGCSPRTVNKHLEHIYDKLGVTNRLAALDAWRAVGRGERSVGEPGAETVAAAARTTGGVSTVGIPRQRRGSHGEYRTA